MSSRRPFSPDCPTCRAPVARVRRIAGDREGLGAEKRRYRCQAEACGWEGLLPRRARRPRQWVLLRRLGRNLHKVMLPAAAIAGFGATLAAVAWQAGLLGPKPATGYALGAHHEGEPLPASHALARLHARTQGKLVLTRLEAAAGVAVPEQPVSALALRYGCVWGQPGRNPYRGTVEQALRSAALPEEVVRSIAAQVKAGQPVDRLEIRNDGVHALGTGRVFDPKNIALTYGQTLCLGSRVNFAAGHMEPAALYEAATADGRVLAVMVPEVCGNVSVLGQRDDKMVGLRLNGSSVNVAGANDARWMPAVLESPAGGVAARSASQDVPEPGTLSCVLAALGALGIVRWLRPGRKRPDQA